MPVLSGLPGTTGDVEAVFILTASEAVEKIQEGYAVTAAADNGAINVWVDDSGKYRCEAQRYCVSVDSQEFNRLMDVAAWVREWLGRIQ